MACPGDHGPISITALRTAAASAVATKYLARKVGGARRMRVRRSGRSADHGDARRRQARTHRRTDLDEGECICASMARKFEATVETTADLTQKRRRTSWSRAPRVGVNTFVGRWCVRGYLSPRSAPITRTSRRSSRSCSRSKVVTDITAQAAAIGDLHHAIVAGAMSADQVHAELGEVVCGRKPGGCPRRRSSSSIRPAPGPEDVAAAIAVYQRARALRAGLPLTLSETEAA